MTREGEELAFVSSAWKKSLSTPSIGAGLPIDGFGDRKIGGAKKELRILVGVKRVDSTHTWNMPKK